MRTLTRVVHIVASDSIVVRQCDSGPWVPPERTALDGFQPVGESVRVRRRPRGLRRRRTRVVLRRRRRQGAGVEQNSRRRIVTCFVCRPTGARLRTMISLNAGHVSRAEVLVSLPGQQKQQWPSRSVPCSLPDETLAPSTRLVLELGSLQCPVARAGTPYGRVLCGDDQGTGIRGWANRTGRDALILRLPVSKPR